MQLLLIILPHQGILQEVRMFLRDLLQRLKRQEYNSSSIINSTIQANTTHSNSMNSNAKCIIFKICNVTTETTTTWVLQLLLVPWV
jgi:hypothetical protein